MLNRPAVTRAPSGGTGERTRPDREAGNVVLTTVVLMIITLLTVVMFIDARRSVLQARLDTAAGRAESGVELAVNEAFARIDGGETATFAGTGTIGDTSYRYTAELVVASTWMVRAEAGSGAVTRAAEATISREARYPYTVFTDVELVSTNNTGTVSGRVGTNGSMIVRGPSPGEVQELYRPDGACDRCVNPRVLDGPRRLPPVTAPADSFAPCPVDGRFFETVDGDGGTPYRCDDPGLPVWFDGEVVVANPPLVVHVGSGVPLTLDGAIVNRDGPASDFRLFVAGAPSDSINDLRAEGATVSGLLFGPGRSLTTSDTTWIGSVTLSRLELTRGGRLSVAEDPTIEPLGVDRWQIVELRSVPSNR